MNSISQIVVDTLQTVVSSPVHDESKIATFFDPGYHQVVDGNHMDYPDFIKHMAVLKSLTKQMRVVIKSVVCEGDTVFTHHVVKVEKNQGERSEFEVLARFTISSFGRIIRCEELTRMTSGVSDDRNLGSRR